MMRLQFHLARLRATSSFRLGVWLAAVIIGAFSATAQDVDHEWVADSTLPHGNGLAAGYRADESIASHPAVIFADDFEARPLGAKWDEANNDGGEALALVDESAAPAPVGNRSLQVTARLGENTGGGLTKWFESSDPLFIRFYTKFDAHCDY